MKREPYIKIDNEIIDSQLIFNAFQRKILFNTLKRALSKRAWVVTIGEDKDSQYIKIKRK